MKSGFEDHVIVEQDEILARREVDRDVALDRRPARPLAVDELDPGTLEAALQRRLDGRIAPRVDDHELVRATGLGQKTLRHPQQAVAPVEGRHDHADVMFFYFHVVNICFL